MVYHNSVNIYLYWFCLQTTYLYWPI